MAGLPDPDDDYVVDTDPSVDNNTPIPPSIVDPADNSSTIIIGVVVGVVALIICVGVGIWWKKNRNSEGGQRRLESNNDNEAELQQLNKA